MTLLVENFYQSRNGIIVGNPKRRGHNLLTDLKLQYQLRKLYEDTLNVEIDKHSWSYKHRVLELAKMIIMGSAFPNAPLGAILARPPSDRGSHTEFLEDTRTFIEEGYRAFSISNWDSILSHVDAVQGQFDEAGKWPKLSLLKLSPQEKPNLIYEWVQQPNGYEDLALTMKILFLAGA